MFEEIVGSSESLQKVLAQVSLASEFPGCACRHAQASRVEVAIHYGSGHFWLRIVDNGKGIDPTILAKGGRSGHHGLPGMKERAWLARGKLTLASKPESGTEIEVTIPASLVYTNPASRHGRWLRERSLTQPGYRELPQSRDRWPYFCYARAARPLLPHSDFIEQRARNRHAHPVEFAAGVLPRRHQILRARPVVRRILAEFQRPEVGCPAGECISNVRQDHTTINRG